MPCVDPTGPRPAVKTKEYVSSAVAHYNTHKYTREHDKFETCEMVQMRLWKDWRTIIGATLDPIGKSQTQETPRQRRRLRKSSCSLDGDTPGPPVGESDLIEFTANTSR